MNIKNDVILARYTTFRIGGPAKYFCNVKNINELQEALKFSKRKNIRFFVLGGGSNVLVSDKGFDGLVIKMEIKGLEFNDDSNSTILSIGAGEDWDGVVAAAIKRNLGGIENLSLIPGTAGAAVYQNIGAYGVELKDVLESAEILNIKSGEIENFNNADCKFGYRDSFFKINKNPNLMIVKVNLKLSKNHKSKIDYPDLAETLKSEKPSVLEVRNAVIKIRRDKLPYPDEVGNAGSFFKNPIVTVEHYENLTTKYPDIKEFKLENGTVKLSAAQLIEKCGWKGKVLGGVGVSEKHSLVLVNYGGGTAKEIANLAEEIKRSVKDEFKVELEPEVEMI